MAIVWGLRNIYYWESSQLDLLVPLILTFSLGGWAVADSKGRREPIPSLSRPWYYLMGILLVPGYVLWTRRWRGLGWLALHSVAWFLLATIAMHAGGTAVFGHAWWEAMGF